MKIRPLSSLLVLLLPLSLPCLTHPGYAQSVNTAQQVLLQGLRSNAGAGNFVAANYAADGSLFLLYDQHDGVHVFKTDAGGTTVLAQAQIGAAGDTPMAMALDPSGNLYVTGTTTSGTLKGTSGAAFASVADTSTNSFLAKYDAQLNLVFLTFLGSGRTAVAAVAATADAVFVTGITFNATTFPVSPSGIQQMPATGSSENGFVERLSADGSTLVYATYLTGAGGDTVPGSIAADAADNAYVAGTTSASGYPTIAALQSRILGTSSGFLSSLNAMGSAFGYSTFIAGTGIDSLALDSSSNTLLLTGNVALGQFPVASVLAPLSAASYLTLLRLPENGQSIASSLLLVPGKVSHVAVGANGSAWIAGTVSTPLFPGETVPDYNAGDSFVLHVTAANTVDQTLRFGGLAINNGSHATLASALATPAVAPNGSTIAVPGSITATIDASLLKTERFDLPFVAAPNVVLPNALRDTLSITCTNSSQCTRTAGLLSLVSTASSAPSLSVSSDDLPNLTLRNLGSATATGLVLAASGYTATSDCGTTLAPSTQCRIALTGTGPGTLTLSAANSPSTTATLAANPLAPDALALSAAEIDYGIVTAVDGVATRNLTVTNLSGSPQAFTAAQDGGGTMAYSFSNAASTCTAGSTAGTYTVAANGSCQLALGLAVSGASTNDGPIRTLWKIGTRDVVLTGFAQAAALNVSSSEVDFGTQIAGATSLPLPRYLYLSNNSATAIPHTAVALPATSTFRVTDACPSTLEPHSVCQLVLTYASPTSPSSDAATLTLDDGLSVLLTGETLPATAVGGSTTNPNLTVSATQLTFATAVAVTGVSSTTQTLTVRNAGNAAFALTLALAGDFTLTSGCPAVLPAGASCSVLIGFAPSQPGTRDGLLSLTTGSSFAPTYVALTGTGSAILPENNGLLDVGETFAGEPVVSWYKVQQSIASLTVASNSAPFGVVLVADTGSGHGTVPANGFAPTATLACGNCWLGVQYLSQTAGTQAAQLTVTSTAAGNPYMLTLTATALPVQGLLLSPLTNDFGPIAIHSASAPTVFTLSNLLPSGSPVTVQSVSASGDFVVMPIVTGGASCSGTVAATASCLLEITFSPTATGDRTGTLTVMTSAGTVTATLSGYGLADPGLGINPTALTFSNVPGSTSTQQTIQLTNTSGTTLAIGTLAASDPSFVVSSACGTLAPAAVCSIAVGFIPQPATTAATLTIPVTSTRNGQLLSTSYSIALSGAYTSQGAGLQIVSNIVNFGSTATAATGETRTLTLNNLSGKTITVGFDMPRNFPLATPSPCPVLAAGASCSFGVSFLPSIGGPLTGSVVVTGSPTDGSAPVQTLAYMLGYGAASGALSVSGAPIPNSPVGFGQVTSGQSTQQALTLSNTGSGPLTIHRLSVMPPFYATSNCAATLAHGQSCTVTLTYAPIDEVLASQSTAPRSDTGTLTIESDAATSPDTVALSGTAVPVTSSSPASSAALNAYSLSTSALTFANTQVGSASAVQPVVLQNVGTTTVHLLSLAAPVDFTATTTCGTVLPGASCTVNVRFTPTAATTTPIRSGTLEILTDAGDALEYITLVGPSAAPPLTLSPAALDFGTVSVGGSDSLTLTVTNTTAAAVLFAGVSATGDYSTSTGTCPASGAALAGGASCSLTATFTPTVTGTRTGTLSLATNATPLPLTASLTGIGVQAHLQVTPGALAFGSIDVGAPASLTLTLLNTGTAAVTGVTNTIGGTGAGAFNVAIPCSVTSLAPNQGCTETVTFIPQAAGAAAATLSIASSDPNGPVAIALSGTGIVAGSFTLSVNGASSATMTVASGSPAVYPLTLTSLNGFAGAVALTCTPVIPGTYATCSLNASTLTLSGAAVNSTATIETISSHVRTGIVSGAFLLGCLLLLPKKRRRQIAGVSALMLLAAVSLLGSGCGSGEPTSKLLYTPSGTYQYRVTASSTSGLPTSSSVTLNLVVQ